MANYNHTKYKGNRKPSAEHKGNKFKKAAKKSRKNRDQGSEDFESEQTHGNAASSLLGRMASSSSATSVDDFLASITVGSPQAKRERISSAQSSSSLLDRIGNRLTDSDSESEKSHINSDIVEVTAPSWQGKPIIFPSKNSSTEDGRKPDSEIDSANIKQQSVPLETSVASTSQPQQTKFADTLKTIILPVIVNNARQRAAEDSREEPSQEAVRRALDTVFTEDTCLDFVMFAHQIQDQLNDTKGVEMESASSSSEQVPKEPRAMARARQVAAKITDPSRNVWPNETRSLGKQSERSDSYKQQIYPVVANDADERRHTRSQSPRLATTSRLTSNLNAQHDNIPSISCLPASGVCFVLGDGLNAPDILEIPFDLDESIVKRWQILPPGNFTTRAGKPTVRVQLLSLPAHLVKAYQPLEEQPVPNTHGLQVQWPSQGQLLIEINRSQRWSRQCFPEEMNSTSPAIDITENLRAGHNMIRFIQLADMQQYTFVLHATPAATPLAPPPCPSFNTGVPNQPWSFSNPILV